MDLVRQLDTMNRFRSRDDAESLRLGGARGTSRGHRTRTGRRIRACSRPHKGSSESHQLSSRAERGICCRHRVKTA